MGNCGERVTKYADAIVPLLFQLPILLSVIQFIEAATNTFRSFFSCRPRCVKSLRATHSFLEFVVEIGMMFTEYVRVLRQLIEFVTDSADDTVSIAVGYVGIST